MNKLAKLGFYDKRTRLILFDCYVRSVLTFGCNVWGSSLIADNLPIQADKEGKFGVFHRRCLRQITGLDMHVRNEMVYLLSAAVPLRVYILKQFARTVDHCRQHDRLVSAFFKWQRTIDSSSVRRKLTVCKLSELAEGFHSIPDVYE